MSLKWIFGIYIVRHTLFNSWQPYKSECISKTSMWMGTCRPSKSALQHNHIKQVGCWEWTEAFFLFFVFFFITGNSNGKGDTNTCHRSTWHPGLFWIPVKAVMGPEQNGAISLSEAVNALITESFSAVLARWQECRHFLCLFSFFFGMLLFLLPLLSPMSPHAQFHDLLFIFLPLCHLRLIK